MSLFHFYQRQQDQLPPGDQSLIELKNEHDRLMGGLLLDHVERIKRDYVYWIFYGRDNPDRENDPITAVEYMTLLDTMVDDIADGDNRDVWENVIKNHGSIASAFLQELGCSADSREQLCRYLETENGEKRQKIEIIFRGMLNAFRAFMNKPDAPVNMSEVPEFFRDYRDKINASLPSAIGTSRKRNQGRPLLSTRQEVEMGQYFERIENEPERSDNNGNESQLEVLVQEIRNIMASDTYRFLENKKKPLKDWIGENCPSEHNGTVPCFPQSVSDRILADMEVGGWIKSINDALMVLSGDYQEVVTAEDPGTESAPPEAAPEAASGGSAGAGGGGTSVSPVASPVAPTDREPEGGNDRSRGGPDYRVADDDDQDDDGGDGHQRSGGRGNGRRRGPGPPSWQQQQQWRQAHIQRNLGMFRQQAQAAAGHRASMWRDYSAMFNAGVYLGGRHLQGIMSPPMPTFFGSPAPPSCTLYFCADARSPYFNPALNPWGRPLLRQAATLRGLRP